MSEFNKDDYLNDLPDPSDAEAAAQASSGLTPPPSPALRRIRRRAVPNEGAGRGLCRS